MFTRGKPAGGAQESKFSFIGPEVTVTGDIVTQGALHIDGKVTGDVRCGTLTQGESGAVHGNIFAVDARLAGLVDGAVEAGTLSLEASARVTGDVLYESLGIATGAEVEGRFRRRRAEAAAALPAGEGSLAAKAETETTEAPRAEAPRAEAPKPRPVRGERARAAPPSLFAAEAPAAEAAE